MVCEDLRIICGNRIFFFIRGGLGIRVSFELFFDINIGIVVGGNIYINVIKNLNRKK